MSTRPTINTSRLVDYFVKAVSNFSVAQKIFFPMLIIVLVLLGDTILSTYQSQQESAIREARSVAAAVKQQVRADRAYYSGVVVSTAKEAGLMITDHYRDATDPAIPLPATFVREVAERLDENASDDDYTYTSLSLFPLNPKKGPRADFEREMMKVNFNQGIEQERTITRNGQSVYTLYVPDFAGESCVECHNNWEGASKTDYQVGNVMGSLVISVPMGERLSNVVESTVTKALLFSVLLSLVGVFYYLRLRVTLVQPLNRLLVAADEAASGNLDAPVLVENQDEIGQLSQAFNDMTTQLRQTIGNLEDRTQQLETVADVTQRLVGILDLNELTSQIVTVVKETFDYYHVHIYLLDEEQETLVMVEGYGEAGAEMKRQGHSILLDAPQSLVAQSARESRVVAVDNVREEPSWLPNDLLPHTLSEIAIPIRANQEIVGVLDIQSDEIAGFSEEDKFTMQILANQVAAAVNNARRFEATADDLAEAEKIRSLYLQQGWQTYMNRQRGTLYRNTQADSSAIDDEFVEQVRQQAMKGQTVVIEGRPENEPENGQSKATLAVPLSIRDQIIGNIRVHDVQDGRRWTSEEIALIEAIGEQMSLAIENARLFNESQENAAREEVIANLTQAIWEGDDIQTILRNAVSNLGTTLQASKVVLRLQSEPEQENQDS